MGHGGFSSFGSGSLEHRLSRRGTQVYLLHSLWGLPRPGTAPASPALAGGIFTTELPARSLGVF